jgi:hypothetical protein
MRMEGLGLGANILRHRGMNDGNIVPNLGKSLNLHQVLPASAQRVGRAVGGDFFQASLDKEERDARFRAEQQARAREQSSTAMGGIGSTEAGVRDLARIGGRKVKKAVPNLNPLRFIR